MDQEPKAGVTLGTLLDEAASRGFILSSISRLGNAWSIVLWRTAIIMDSDHIVTHGPDPCSALRRAIDNLASNVGIIPAQDRTPTCIPDDILAGLVSNLPSPTPITLSPPRFKLKL